MAYNLGVLTNSVKTRAKDATLSDSLIMEHIDATQTAVLGHKRYSFMERNLESARLSRSASSYDLECDVQTVDYLALTGTDGQTIFPTYVPPASWGDLTPANTATSGVPARFTIYGRQLLFDAKAEASYDLTMRYLAAPRTLSKATDIPDIPESYREILIRGGLAGVEEYRDNFDLAAIHTRRAEELAEDMTNRYGLLRQTMTAKRKAWSFRNGEQ